MQVRKTFCASTEFLCETHTAIALRQGPVVSAATPTDDASIPWRSSVGLANSHLDGLSIGCVHARRGAAETDDTPKGFGLELQEQRKSLGRYKRPTTLMGMRRVVPARLHRHRLTDD